MDNGLYAGNETPTIVYGSTNDYNYVGAWGTLETRRVGEDSGNTHKKTISIQR
mgnify:CR=1 FL=1